MLTHKALEFPYPGAVAVADVSELAVLELVP
jgi:hypothetical protein